MEVALPETVAVLPAAVLPSLQGKCTAEYRNLSSSLGVLPGWDGLLPGSERAVCSSQVARRADSSCAHATGSCLGVDVAYGSQMEDLDADVSGFEGVAPCGTCVDATGAENSFSVAQIADGSSAASYLEHDTTPQCKSYDVGMGCAVASLGAQPEAVTDLSTSGSVTCHANGQVDEDVVEHST